MEVSEEEFQSLKVEQSILVDFHQFPDKFIELLEECVSSRGEANPRFLAVLRLGAEEGDDSALGVVETNKFKHLSHISLAFAPGDDASIKKYLAARLSSSAPTCGWDEIDDLALEIDRVCCGADGSACPDGNSPDTCTAACAVSFHQFTTTCATTLGHILPEQDPMRVNMVEFEQLCIDTVPHLAARVHVRVHLQLQMRLVSSAGSRHNAQDASRTECGSLWK